MIVKTGMSHLLATTLGLITPGKALLALSLFVITFTFSLAAISFILIKLPPTYFQRAHSRAFWVDRHATLRWAGAIGKNLLGIVLVLLGIVMALPGVPGQGILTILLGIMLIDLPGKSRLEYKILSQPRVLEKINRLRGKFSRPPLVLD